MSRRMILGRRSAPPPNQRASPDLYLPPRRDGDVRGVYSILLVGLPKEGVTPNTVEPCDATLTHKNNIKSVSGIVTFS